ncbi:MAG TPA: hypothetical protein EYO58_10925 [Flavobacteriales bacterium]|nr:hypothetical protein [Flavobacteriales bacterium]
MGGCTDPAASNYDPNASWDDGSCIPWLYGCMDDGFCVATVGQVTGPYHLYWLEHSCLDG